MTAFQTPVVRVEYVRANTNGELTSVIYEVTADREEHFFESGFNEMWWYKFTPTAFELEMARGLAGKAGNPPLRPAD